MTFAAFTGKVYNPDLKFSQGGKPYFTCTVQERHRDKNRDTGQYENAGVTWHRLTYFGNKMYTPEALAEQAVEGSTLVLFGESKRKEFDKRDGSKGEAQEIIPEAGTVGVVAVAPEYAPDAPSNGAQQARGGSQGGFGSPGVSGGFGGRENAAQGSWGGGFDDNTPAPF